MGKRKLSLKQKRRIQESQEKKIQDASSDDIEKAKSGLVISHYGQTLEIEAENKEIIRCHVRQNLDALVTGDRVLYIDDEGSKGGVVVACLPRKNVLKRPDKYKEFKYLAANIDHIMIVAAVFPEPIPYLIDRYLVAAEIQGIKPAIIFNKVDLFSKDANLKKMHTDMLTIYQDLGYDTLVISAKNAEGIAPVIQYLENSNSILVGQSGVGKSALINAIFEREITPVGEVSISNKKGRHTTTTARLYHCKQGVNLIDSPGIREFGLWDKGLNTIASGFVEFNNYIGTCQFRDCKHINEKGCAILKAMHEGHIHPSRVSSYHRIINDLD